MSSDMEVTFPTNSPGVVPAIPTKLNRTRAPSKSAVKRLHRLLDSETVPGGLTNVRVGSSPCSQCAKETAVNPGTCAIFACSLARLVTSETGALFLELPDPEDSWEDPMNDLYSSCRIFVRQAYVDIQSIIFSRVYSLPEKIDRYRMMLAGTHGAGKSFFTRYFVWSLLHPPEGQPMPDAIVWKHDQSSPSGSLYYHGEFYTISNADELVGDEVAQEILLGGNSWIIWDGRPPQAQRYAKTLVVLSPERMFAEESHVQKYREVAKLKVYNTPWSFDELVTAATEIHDLPPDTAHDVVLRSWKLFGGVPRLVLDTDNIAGTNSAALRKVDYAIDKMNLERIVVAPHTGQEIDTSGVLFHLIPTDDYITGYSYQWASTEIMLRVFHQIFRATKSSIQVQIPIGGSISGACGLFFEPWFHNRIAERGYKGRFREVEKAPDGGSADAKRNLFGGIKSTKYKIPMLLQNRFYRVSEIQPEKYNIPLNKNFPTIDSLCPARGEMFQVTWSEDHGITAYKAQYLMSLKPKFKQFLKDNPNEKVKMIFVVPPHNFDTFRRQSYLGLAAADPPTDPTSNTTQALQPKKNSSLFNLRSKTTKTKATESAGGTTEDEIDSWIVQCVLSDMDVNPLEEAIRIVY
jgi:hypothetical protein